MAQGRKKNNFVPRTCVSPLWKDSTSSNAFKPPRMHMRPPQAPLTSLDTFMAAHSPRRFCQAREKYLLKPLTVDKRITDTGYVRVQQKTRNDSSDARCNTVHHRQSHRCATHSNTYTTTDSSSEGEVNSQRVVALGKCELQNEDLVASDASSELYRSSFFRPGPKIPMTFNRSTSIPTLMHPGTTDLIAIGTIPITSQRQTPVKPMSRSSSEEDIQLMPKTKTGGLWKTKATLNLKGCKYPDPMIGASPAFQARITEMAQMEVETIKFEKTKKTRKKTSSS